MKDLTINDVLQYKGSSDIYCINQKCKDWEQGDRYGCRGSFNNCKDYIPFTNLDPEYYLTKAKKSLESCKKTLKIRKHDIPLYKKLKTVIMELNDQDYIRQRLDIDYLINSDVKSMIHCEKRIPELESFIANFKDGELPS